MKFIAHSLSLAALLSMASGSNAQLAFDRTGGSFSRFGSSLTVGYTFDVLSPITVFELEMYRATGFQSAVIPVGIWSGNGTLLTSANISPFAPATTTPSVGGDDFLGEPIAPLALTPGTYTIGAFGTGLDSLFSGGTIIADPAVSYGLAAFIVSNGLAQPVPGGSSVGAFGPSFKFRPSAAVPEPGSITLLVGMASASGMALRRRK